MKVRGWLAVVLFGVTMVTAWSPLPPLVDSAEPVTLERGPVDLALLPGGSRALTANRAAGTVSLIDLSAGRVLAEVAVGEKPSAVAIVPGGELALVSATYSGEVVWLSIQGDRLSELARVRTSYEPRGIAVSPDGKKAYVGLGSGSSVAVLDIAGRREVERIEVGRWPRHLALSPDGKTLAVGVSGDGGVAVVDTTSRKRIFLNDFMGLNLGEMQISRDGQHAYFPWIIYRHNPISVVNIRLGWVLASRLGRVRLDGQARREAISLDPPRLAVGDPHGLALSPDESLAVVAASGSQELLFIRLAGLPWMDYGNTDHIDPKLLADHERFDRLTLGGRPMAVRFSPDGQQLYVTNALKDSVQIVDVAARKVLQEIDLGGPKTPSLARRGEAIFYDARRSLDQWYSCHSCHYEGHTNAIPIDTFNDGSDRTPKMVLSLRNVTKTGPWTWHGWQKDLDFAMRKSLMDSMLGPKPTDDDVKALVAYLATLKPPTNPVRLANPELSESAQRGEVVFRSSKANCIKCHSGEFFTDGKIHEVGTRGPRDYYKGYNTPSLLGTFDRTMYLHDGRAKSLRQLLTGDHAPEKVTDNGRLTDDELNDLIEYLKTL